MPRKSRVAEMPGLVLADVFFEWLDQRANGSNDWSRFSSLNEPLGAWEVDAFAQFLSDGEGHAKIRRAVVMCLHATVDRTEELYRRRQEADIHRKRAMEARKLADAINQFLDGRGADLPALGVRGDYKHFRRAQIAIDRESDALCEWQEMLAAGPRLRSLLERFAQDRDQLDLPPRDKTDFLSMVFVGNIRGIAGQLFERLSVADLHRFALAAWRDIGFPLPQRDELDVPEAWIGWMDKKFARWDRLPPEKKGAIGFSQHS